MLMSINMHGKILLSYFTIPNNIFYVIFLSICAQVEGNSSLNYGRAIVVPEKMRTIHRYALALYIYELARQQPQELSAPGVLLSAIFFVRVIFSNSALAPCLVTAGAFDFLLSKLLKKLARTPSPGAWAAVFTPS